MTWLTLALTAFALASWCSTFLLVRAALRRPYIGALTERAILSVLLAVFGTVCVALVWNTDAGAVLPTDAARVVFRVCLAALLLVPPVWLWAYLTDRLGGGS